jgi:hypothetical protein
VQLQRHLCQFDLPQCRRAAQLFCLNGAAANPAGAGAAGAGWRKAKRILHLMRWLFLGVLVVLVGLILSIGFMNHSSRRLGGGNVPADQQIAPTNDQTLIPRQPGQ